MAGPPSSSKPAAPVRLGGLETLQLFCDHVSDGVIWIIDEFAEQLDLLGIAEIEISIFEHGCLSRPVGDIATLEQRVSALEAKRNARRATVDWQFTSCRARIKLTRLDRAVQSHQDWARDWRGGGRAPLDARQTAMAPLVRDWQTTSWVSWARSRRPQLLRALSISPR
jgi:hypothetical protein